MNFFHLKYFVDAARAGGLSAAARKNFVTQSAVSRAIAKLEEDLGVELVIHKQNCFQLTEAGGAILTSSDDIFDSVKRLKEAAVEHGQNLRGPLRMGCNQAIASKIIGPMLPRIAASYPEVEPSISLGNTDQIQRMIDKREIDFGIVMDDGEVNKIYKTTRIYSGTFVVVKSPKFEDKNIGDNLIVSRTKPGGMSDHYTREYKKAYGQPTNPKMVVASWQVIMDLAIEGFGYALVPLFLCEDEIAAKKLEVVKHRVKPLPFGLCTIVSGNRTLPKNAGPILEYFRDLNDVSKGRGKGT